jgi:two-component system, NarL family, nitrate/nitrite response regulator NarL
MNMFVIRPMRVVVISEVRIYRQGLAQLFGAEDGVELAGTVPQVADVSAVLGRAEGDVILLDMTGERGGERGMAALRQLTGDTDVPVVVLGIPDRPDEVVACAEAGIAGYVTNENSFDELVSTLRAATRGEFSCQARIAAGLVLRLAALARERRRSPVAQLTTRELEIVTLIDSGFSNKQIASRLHIQLATVKNHVHNILDKLGVNGRGEAAAAVRRYRAAQ